jgi:hypothetical protein
MQLKLANGSRTATDTRSRATDAGCFHNPMKVTGLLIFIDHSQYPTAIPFCFHLPDTRNF